MKIIAIMSQNPVRFHTAAPSEWYSLDKLDTGTHKKFLLWDLYSVIGTPLDIEYPKKTFRIISRGSRTYLRVTYWRGQAL